MRRRIRDYRADDLFRAAAARMSVLKASSSISSPALGRCALFHIVRTSFGYFSIFRRYQSPEDSRHKRPGAQPRRDHPRQPQRAHEPRLFGQLALRPPASLSRAVSASCASARHVARGSESANGTSTPSSPTCASHLCFRHSTKSAVAARCRLSRAAGQLRGTKECFSPQGGRLLTLSHGRAC
jgi:hypothetical protein